MSKAIPAVLAILTLAFPLLVLGADAPDVDRRSSRSRSPARRRSRSGS